MAFIQPTRLPSLGLSSSSVPLPLPLSTSTSTCDAHSHRTPTTTVCTLDSRFISTARHRRLFDFFQAASDESPSSSPPSLSSSMLQVNSSAVITSSSSTSTPDVTSPEYAARLAAIRDQILSRSHSRRQANANASATQQAEWNETIDRIEASKKAAASSITTTSEPVQTPTITTQTEVEVKKDVPDPTPVAEVEVEQTPSTSTLDDKQESQPEPEAKAKAQPEPEPEPVVASAPDPIPTPDPTPAPTPYQPMDFGPPASVAELYGPAGSDDKTIANSSSTSVSSSSSSSSVSELYQPAPPAPKSKPEPVTKVETPVVKEKVVAGGSNEKEEGTDLKSLGKALLEVITEGVPSRSSTDEETEQGKGQSQVQSGGVGMGEIMDKSQVVYLVDTGKVKNLTVMKLRRLLAAHNLKTSGRKSELIARLTSFAKSSK